MVFAILLLFASPLSSQHRVSNFIFESNKQGLIISGYAVTPQGALVIPDSLDGIPVTAIAENAFYWCDQITSLVLPGSVREIGRSAFCHCSALRSIDFGSNSLLVGLGVLAFANCFSLRPPRFPDSLRRIGALCFRACHSFNKVTIPARLEYIGEGAFACCRWLQAFEVADSNPHFSARDGILFGQSLSVVVQFPPASSTRLLRLPDAVKRIGNYSFADAKSLREVDFPDSVVRIGYRAFAKCRQISVLKLPRGVRAIEGYAFHECDGIQRLEFRGQSLASIGEFAFASLSLVSELDLPDSLRFIGPHAFAHCINLVTLQLPKGLTTLSRAAFYKCRKLISVRIPDALKVIQPYAFYGCRSMRSVVFPPGSRTTVIGAWSFAALRSLTTLRLPDSLRVIAQFAFMQDWSLVNVKLPPGLREVREMSFWNCSKLKHPIVLPKSVKVVERKAFDKSKVRVVALFDCRINVTVESFPENADCLSVPKKCEAKFSSLFGKTVNGKCTEGITPVEAPGPGAAYMGFGTLCVSTSAFIVWKMWDSLRGNRRVNEEQVPLIEKTSPLWWRRFGTF